MSRHIKPNYDSYVKPGYDSVVRQCNRMYPVRLVEPAIRCFCIAAQLVVVAKGSAQYRRLQRRYDAANAAYRVIENNP